MRTAKKKRPNGYVIYENSDIVIIATGFSRKSANPKTGDMIQVWILVKAVNPVRALKTGQDIKVCLDCGQRGNKGKARICYVRVANAPLGIWKAWKRGMYPTMKPHQFAAAFQGRKVRRKVRFGAYGEPVLLPLKILAALAKVSDGWTGYTHQWKRPEYQKYRPYLMASCDTALEREQAKAMGWRVFRVRSEFAPILPGEIMCPASEEAGKLTTCADCKLCSGVIENDPRKDIVIIVHGVGAKRFELIQLAA